MRQVTNRVWRTASVLFAVGLASAPTAGLGQTATVETETLSRPEGFAYEWKHLTFNQTGEAVAVVAHDAGRFRWVTSVAETPIHNMDPGVPITLSDDGEHYAYSLVHDDERTRFIIDGKAQEKFHAARRFTFSPDGQRHAYEVLIDSGGGWYHDLVVDGEVQGERSLGIYHPTFSPDSKRLAYIYLTGEHQALRIDGDERQVHPGLLNEPITWSRDSKRVAYRFSNSRTGKPVHLTDSEGEVKLGPVRQVGHMAYMPDGTLVCNAGLPATGGMTFYEDGQAVGEPYDWTYFELRGNPDGSKYAYVAAKGEERYLAVNRDIGEQSYDGVSNGAIEWSPDGERLAFAAKVDNQWHVALRGEERMTEVDKVFLLGFTPDSERWIAVVNRNGERVLLLDGEPVAEGIPEPAKGASIWFSEDTTLHYWARTGDDLARVDISLTR